MDAAQYVDTFELTRLGLEVKGSRALERFERLVDDLPDQSDSIASWSVRGEQNALGRFLDVRIEAVVVLECQRCLGGLPWPVDIEVRLHVVDDGAVHDGEPRDGDVERIVGSRRFDLWELIEDEIILSLPYVPKHDACPPSPDAGPPDAPESGEGRPSPFAALGRLKKD